ncbi:uncharacterized protein SETTUDRAFT_181954, partial [Exserohilum turcica Et28A]
MTEATPTGAAPPKKRSLFKRPAWQDSPKNEDADIFSHSNEFSDIVAEQARRREEEKKKKRHGDRKRRRTSDHGEEPSSTTSGAGRTSSKTRSKTLLSPVPKHSSPSSRAPSTCPSVSLPQKESLVIALDDSDDDDSKPHRQETTLGPGPVSASHLQDMAVRPSRPSPVVIPDDEDDEAKDDSDSEFAALRARALARIAAKAKASSTEGVEGAKAPVTQLLITSEIPNTSALMVKVRVDTLIEKPRKAWCAKQGFAPRMEDSVFFTWKGTRIYDSTSIMRLGIQIGAHGSVTVDGDSNIYDDVNLPKIHVEAWTDELFREHKREEAAAAAAKKLAAEAPLVLEERTPTPEPTPPSTKLRLILRAKGKADFGLTVNPHTTIAHIANAYKTKLDID